MREVCESIEGEVEDRGPRSVKAFVDSFEICVGLHGNRIGVME